MSKLGIEGHKRHFRKVFKSQNDKIMNSNHLLKLKREENVGSRGFEIQWQFSFYFRERTSSFSLEIHAIQQLAIFGARRKNVLRGAAYAWVYDL